MVDAEDIVHLGHALHPLHPPVVLPDEAQVEPAVQRVAPELAGLGKIVRRDAGHPLRDAPAVQLEDVRMGPGVRGILRHVDRHVAEEADAEAVAVGFPFIPLGKEEVLDEKVEVDLAKGIAYVQGNHNTQAALDAVNAIGFNISVSE